MLKEAKYFGIMLSVLLLFIGIYKTHLEPFYSFSLRFNDVNYLFQNKKASEDILFIKIDERSVNAFGRWPWDRSVLASAIDKLDDSNILILDMVFSEPTSSDETLAKSLQNQDNSLCGFFLRHKASAKVSSSQLEVLSDSSLERLKSQTDGTKVFIQGQEAEVNIEPILSSCTMSATFSTISDADHIYREYPIAFSYADELYPSLGVQSLRMLYNKDVSLEDSNIYALGEHSIYTNEEGFSLLNYYLLDSYQTYSFMDLYEGRLTKELLKDKMIIFGITEIGVGDIRATPVGMIPGPIIHYTFISNVLNDELLYVNKYITYISVYLFFFLPLIWFFVSSISKRFFIYASSYFVFFIFSKLSFVYFDLYVDAFYPIFALVLSAIVSEALLHQKQEQQTQFIKGAFSSYLSPVLLKKLADDPKGLSLGGQKKELTIFFSDIRSFTSISEKMNDPEKLTSFLNRYFTPMSDIVLKYEGMIDKYIGDAIMAFYNAPLDVKNHATQACRASLEMLDKLEKLNIEFEKDGLPLIKIGIGLNTAEVVVGNMGSLRRFNYTVIGDGVNLASRVEGINKRYGTSILITEFTKSQIDAGFLTRELEKVQVKGKEEEIMLYELLKDSEENRIKIKEYNIAMTYYKDGNIQKALESFELLSKEDSVSKYFFQRIKDEY